VTYSYDGVGNRQGEGGSLGSNSYSYTDNLLTGVTGTKNLSYSYDAVGNAVGENNFVFTYNENDRLIEVADSSTSTTLGSYTYDGQGRRVKKVANSQTTYYMYDQQSRLIAELDSSGNIKVEYIYLSDRPLVKIDIGSTSEEPYYYHTDHLGTPLFMTDSTGQKVWSEELLPFGEGYDINEDVDGDQVHVVNNLRFPGQYYDAETGLHYNIMRDYSPQIGRYMEPDPIGLAGGINTFAYVENSPVNWIDLWGLLLTDAQIANIIFNETRSLSGKNISEARQYIAHAIINGDEKLGEKRPITAPTTAKIPKSEQAIYQSILEDVARVRNERVQGIDSTHSAMHFNFRNTDSTAPFYGLSVQTHVGPLENSYTGSGLNRTGVWANTYGEGNTCKLR